MSADYQTEKCKWPDGISVMPDGVNELDPCVYEDVEVHRGVTVIVQKCKVCGHVEITWMEDDVYEALYGEEDN